MPLYRCDWPNGDVSWVLAKSVAAAIEELDEAGDADESFLTPVKSFSIHLALTENAQDCPVRGCDDESDLPEDYQEAEARLHRVGWIAEALGDRTEMPLLADVLERRKVIELPDEPPPSTPQRSPAKVLPFRQRTPES